MIKPLQFLEYLDIMITSGKDEDNAEISEDERKNGVVSLYSIHKAKGLEFLVVIVPNCDLALSRRTILPKIIYDTSRPALAVHKSILDKDSKIDDKDYDALYHGRFRLNLEEELRIFYVACTHAKNLLVLSCRGNIEQVQQNRDTTSWIRWALDSELNEIEPLRNG